jgi:hypothetical protein
MAIAGGVLWVALFVVLWALMRSSARRDKAQERAHQDWLIRGWSR